jgi:hypothetical protein
MTMVVIRVVVVIMIVGLILMAFRTRVAFRVWGIRILRRHYLRDRSEVLSRFWKCLRRVLDDF